jgi:hypothetical protein
LGFTQSTSVGPHKDGYVAAGKECVYTGLCSYACDLGFCPSDYCTSDSAQKGKCVEPADPDDGSNNLGDGGSGNLTDLTSFVNYDSTCPDDSHINTLEDLEAVGIDVDQSCVDMWTLKVLYKVNEDSYKDYQTVNKDFDNNFKLYQRYIYESIPEAIDQYMLDSKGGPGEGFQCEYLPSLQHSSRRESSD